MKDAMTSRLVTDALIPLGTLLRNALPGSGSLSGHCFAMPCRAVDPSRDIASQCPAGQWMAIWRRGRPRELLHHSDQGSQSASEAFQRLMADTGVTCSMSRSGNVWDNAAMESFFSSLKTERTRGRICRTWDQARADVVDDIERFYTPVRRHSTIGDLSPILYEERAMKAQVTVHKTGRRPTSRTVDNADTDARR